MKVSVYNQKGEAKESREVKAPVFNVAVNPALIHEVVVSQQADRRLAPAKVKTRAEVRGGGKKPYKQKGTGRARTGSIRNPIWRGGGITFGPTGIQNFALKVLKKKRRGAIVSSLASRKDNVAIVESFDFEKTKDVANLVPKILERGHILFVTNIMTEKTILSTRNINNVRVCDYRNLNVYDILWSDKLVFVADALELTNEFWGTK